jgi:hypothetical protein
VFVRAAKRLIREPEPDLCTPQAIDLVLDRPRLARSQFVYTQVKGREAIFWQSQKTARAANPGGRIPRRPGRAEHQRERCPA